MVEVEKASFSMGSLKAPGPDGSNGLFYQKNWETLKEDIYKMVQQFFDTSELELDFNATNVVVVPKVPMAESISQLRPISCCNFIYKIISKVIVNKLKPHMNGLISPNRVRLWGED